MILIAALLFSCTPASRALVGKWECDVPFGDIIAKGGTEESDAGYSALLDTMGADFSDVTVKITLEFFGDGKYKATIDKEDLRAALERYYDAVFSFASETYDTPIEEVVATAGYSSVEDAADQALLNFTYIDRGDYGYKRGSLTLGGATFSVALSDSSLTISSVTSGADGAAIVRGGLLPLEFKRG